MRTLRDILTSPEPETAVRELAHEDLCRAMGELRSIRRANEWVAEAWALVTAEAARRFEEVARATDFFEDLGLPRRRPTEDAEGTEMGREF